MRKMFAVLKREYISAVRKKMFIFMTLFFPVLMAGLITLPGIMMARGIGEKNVVVLDGTGALGAAFSNVAEIRGTAMPKRDTDQLNSKLHIDYVDAHGHADLKATAQPYLDRLNADRKSAQKLDGVLLVPADAFDATDARMAFYSRSSTDMITQARLERAANRAIQRRRFLSRGIDEKTVAALTREVPVDAVQISKTGEQKKGGEANILIGFIFAALLVMPSFVYGVETMRGIIQEKTDRVIEILVSSMSPAQLLIGKVTGVALVGLTQVTVWLIIAAGAASFGAATAAMAGINVMQWIHPATFVYFIVFFLLAYFTYVCIYAVAGAICNSDKEAQQMIAPISMLMMLPWFLMVAIITNPDSSLALGFSLAPVFGPITMFVRTLVSEPPMSQVLLSIAISLVTIAVFYWATAKIFRIGILSYGKRPTIPELWRWVKVA